jgi:hypothetical protein
MKELKNIEIVNQSPNVDLVISQIITNSFIKDEKSDNVYHNQNIDLVLNEGAYDLITTTSTGQQVKVSTLITSSTKPEDIKSQFIRTYKNLQQRFKYIYGHDLGEFSVSPNPELGAIKIEILDPIIKIILQKTIIDFQQWLIKVLTLTSEILLLQKSNAPILKGGLNSAFIQRFINSGRVV